MTTTTRSVLVFVLFLLRPPNIQGESLTPPYFNLAEGKNITASATCGEGIEGPELFCKLIGADSENELSVNLIQGQYCDICDPNRPDKRHPPEFAVDGREAWWQSPPLSRGMKYNEVNLTIDLGQEFHVAYVYIKMANSPRPGLWILEKSVDHGKTFTPWQYFSDNPSDCETFFGKKNNEPIKEDDSVICTNEYSKIVPLEGGEIPISLLNQRPSANFYFNSTVLQEWTRATNVRLRFLRTKNLLGHLMSVARQDPTVTRRYFYSIKEISIGGRCMCNGHAEACDIPDPRDNKVLLCNCKHNTCGAKCNKCCPGYEQKAWRISKLEEPFSCEPCNCFGHSDTCVYDEEIDRKRLSLDIHGKYDGGGVCKNCRDNTDGINCNKCVPKYFRPYHKHWNETDVCQPCQCETFFSTGNCSEGSGRCECRKEFTPPNCDSCSFGHYGYPDCKPCDCYLNGTRDLQCAPQHGDCTCLSNYGGKFCRECAEGFFDFPHCSQCECNPKGSVSSSCDQLTGQCTCRNTYDGLKCEQCRNGYFYKDDDCVYCNCDTGGTEPEICSKETGTCMCKPGYGGARCDTCLLGYYGYPDCKPCDCSKQGSHGTSCGPTGKCSCLFNYAGKTCNQCNPGYYDYPDCKSCNCTDEGSVGLSCDQTGKCQCKGNFAGPRCDVCEEGFYNFPACEDCNCHPAGVVEGFAGCGSVPAGELCQCKERVEGRICDRCRPLYWNLNLNNPNGCEECDCNRSGVLGGIGVCDTESGQCVCKPAVVSRSCSVCSDGTYALEDTNLFGCIDCGCDVGGSINNICDKKTGQCTCQPRVEGRTCTEPLQAHYFPTLYQYQYELEDGHSPENSRVRYEYDEKVFANFSWKGYAVFSSVQQREVIQEIAIMKPSLYRMVFRFVNPNPHTVIGSVRVVADNPGDYEQEIKVQFRNTSQPELVTVSGETGNIAKPFVLNPGRWSVIVNVNETVFLDYFVLLPEDFYLATVLNQKIEKPCTIGERELCVHHAYPNSTIYDKSWGSGGFRPGNQPVTEWFKNTTHLRELTKFTHKVPLLDDSQSEVSFNISLETPGDYVIVVDYVTPLDDLRTHQVDVIRDVNDGQLGTLKLYACPYTFLCRQVVINNDREGVSVYNVNGNYIVITLKSTQSNVGIQSVTAIPLSEWSLDFITPKPVCVRKNDDCIPFTFPDLPESKRIPFNQETGDVDELAKNRPPTRQISNTTYVWLNPADTTVDLRGKVPQPGAYAILVHYHQPHYSAFDAPVVVQNGVFYEASVRLEHCPSTSGCRAAVTLGPKGRSYQLTENFMVTVRLPEDRDVYLEYLLVVPEDLYDERSLQPGDLDRTGEFVSTCGRNHFNIDTTAEGFCKKAAFSISAAHNTGAIPCSCDYEGSTSFECEKFGGQCPCKPNIIGRKCEACRVGFYGFPDCKPCRCPSTAYCQPNTGECICPTHVIGENCDQCEPNTYGYHPIVGCEECRCHYLGTNGTSQCDLLSGACPCKPNIMGRTCDRCRSGAYAFPYCESCECNTAGTTADICDNRTAECFCKANVVGPHCEFCREGSFHLEASNPAGCTECFCFGKTSRCSGSGLAKVALHEMADWELVAVEPAEELNVTSLHVELQDFDDGNGVVGVDFDYLNVSTAYFAAPSDYLGKKLTSYGGFLNYSIFYDIGTGGSAVSGPDVILAGRTLYLTFNNLEQPPASLEFLTTLQLVENNFDLSNGEVARREHIMEVLKDLRGVYIRATYWTKTKSTRLMNVVLDEAIEVDGYASNSPLAQSVEHCHCPPNYQGLSCEDCSPGYYRIPSGPYGGVCVPCDCHGHADECDVNTGKCINCVHNTRGDHCEFCEVGYHGNALAGTPNDCLICACPLPIASNNFATACDLSSDGEKISCECKEGYIGARCHSCAPGFYGRPEQQGDYCKPCQCSGNINPDDPYSCDTVTGDCKRCLNNTYGEACAVCKPWFYGDAVSLKNCQMCVCDNLGAERCDSFTGKCVCKPNVIGEKCDRCADEHFGFPSGAGCRPCECGAASESNQCFEVTGQCKCKPGATGRACDRCSAGYWNYTSEGCVSCGCKSEYSLGFGCNALTGQCECLQGVIGEKCNQCPHRWAFEPNFGCHQCDSCHHALLDETDSLAALIDPVISDFGSTQSGYFTRRRLENMREQLDKLQPVFDEVNPSQINLNDSIKTLEGLEQDSKNLNRKSNFSLVNSETTKNTSEKLKDKIELMLDELSQVEEDAIRTAENIDKIFTEMHQQADDEVDKALQEGQAMLDEMKSHNLTKSETNAVNSFNKVEELLKNVTQFKAPVDELKNRVQTIEGDLKRFNDKLDGLYNHTQFSLNMAKEAEDIIAKIGKDRLKTKLDDIETKLRQSKINLDDSDKYLKNASDLLTISVGKLKNLQDAPESLTTVNRDFNAELERNRAELDDIARIKPQVEEHANSLSDRVQQLEHILSESQFGSQDAVKAARAYKDIVEAVKDAREAADAARLDADHAADILNNVQERCNDAETSSAKALDDAYASKRSTVEELEPRLKNVSDVYEPIKEMLNDAGKLLDDIQKIMDNIHVQDLDERYKTAADNADDAFASLGNVKVSYDNLPKEKEQAALLPKEIDDMRRNIGQTDKQITSVNERLPPIAESLNRLPQDAAEAKVKSDAIRSNLMKLKEQIEVARDIANRIKVGMRFFTNTTLELRNPKNLEALSSSSKFSGYFKTSDPKGLVFYIGNPNATHLPKPKSEDYMALIIQNGFPVLKFNIGNGNEQIINPKYVADDQWYQYIIERIGFNTKLSIREDLGKGLVNVTTAEKSTSGPYTVFNLDQENSKIFVGSVPNNYQVPEGLDSGAFSGEMEDMVIGNTPVSLWNFNEGYENNHGALERDKLVNLSPSNGFRFDGNGYSTLDIRFVSIRSKSTIQLYFKTFSKTGLIFLALGERSKKMFISLEMHNGKVLYQYNLGGATKKWITSKNYNDGEWHKVTASRDGPNGKLVVDSEDVIDMSAPISESILESMTTISFGGYPYKHNQSDVTSVNFDGCITNITINGEAIDLANNIQAFGVEPGCPDKWPSMVSFARDNYHYVGWDKVALTNEFNMSLRFKTKDADGLILHISDPTQDNLISLTLLNGKLILVDQKIELQSKGLYNDNEWHVVSVIHNHTYLRMDIDDTENQVTDTQPPFLHSLTAGLYVGGLPKRINQTTTPQLFGCITDLTVNGRVMNFIKATAKHHVILDKCILDPQPADHEHTLPDLKQTENTNVYITEPPVATTENPTNELDANRGDGGKDYRPIEPQPEPEPEPEVDLVITTVHQTEPTTKPPPPTDRCALPPNPVQENEQIVGYRFVSPDSRLECKTARGKYKKNFDFRLEFKTREPDGVLFYVTGSSSTQDRKHYAAVYLLNGHVMFSFRGDGETLAIKSAGTYSDGEWHMVEFTKEHGQGKLVMDQEDIQYGSLGPGPLMLDLQPPFYVGGLNPELYQSVQQNLNTSAGFSGCIRSLSMNSRPLEPSEEYGVIPCSDNLELGTYFGGGSHSYVRLKEKYKVGVLFSIKMDVKPRSDSGLLVAAHGKRDYYILELVNGTVRLHVENGKGPFSAIFIPPHNNPFHLCDGNWHNIQAVKSKNVVTLSVDNMYTDPKIGPHSKSTDTGSALFLGGHRYIHRVRGIHSRTSFTGCIKNIEINNEPLEITSSMINQNITIGFCPTN
ncbi:unnamed protein product [Phyllotreta striolata]|uniref:Laminin subunit alpha n=1 Tax=Phyllotreta striolata TaxID=444603 RepID=A0A9N9TS26_PHYSR|nr:unnamed protein product [Phyllotreta striolata]